MGMDTVELVLDLEERFLVRLPDAECARVRTVADLAALIVAKLPVAGDVCPTARAFYELRRLIVEDGGAEGRRVRPSMRIVDLLGPRWRRTWRRMQSQGGHLPRLIAPAWVKRATNWAIFASIVVGLVVLGAALFTGEGLFGSVGLGLGVAFIGVVAISVLSTLLERRLPENVHTVGDAARLMAAETMPQGGGERLIAELRVLEVVSEKTALLAGVPLEQVKPESDFVRDLNF